MRQGLRPHPTYANVISTFAQMKLSLWMLLAALIAAVVAAPTASADEATHFPAGVLCAFPVSMVGTGEHGSTSTERITNTASGRSITVRIAGSSTLTTLSNGDIRVTARGQVLQFYFAGDVNGPAMFLAKGRAVDIFDANTGVVTSSHVNGQRIDLCARLS